MHAKARAMSEHHTAGIARPPPARGRPRATGLGTWWRLAFIWRVRERGLQNSPFVFKGKLHSLLCFKEEILRLSPNRQSKRKFLETAGGAPPPSCRHNPWPHRARDKPSPAGRQAQLPGPGSRRPSSHPPSQVARLPSARLEARLLDLLPQARHGGTRCALPLPPSHCTHRLSSMFLLLLLLPLSLPLPPPLPLLPRALLCRAAACASTHALRGPDCASPIPNTRALDLL